jgi:Histidine kinase-, DNA gyrase B-, and HSP90-like ATPase
MELRKLFETGALRLPWPTLVGGEPIAADMEPLSLCRDCKSKGCSASRLSMLGQICEFGLSYYGAMVSGVPIVIYGLTGLSDKELLIKRVGRAKKDELRGRGPNQATVVSWIESIKKLERVLQSEQDALIGDKLEALHETPKIAEEIRRSAEALIFSKNGANLEEKFSAATVQERTLYKASQILVDTFDLLTVFLNPESASLGELESLEPYRLIHKLSFVLNSSGDGGRRCIVRFQGESRRRYLLHDSFKIIPMVLLNNAFKYTVGGQSVEIVFEDKARSTLISVISYGPLIAEEELSKIFMRRYRGGAAKKLNSEGMGIGLFVAQAAAKANGTRIGVTSKAMGTTLNGYEMAVNCFSFEVKDASQRRIDAFIR